MGLRLFRGANGPVYPETASDGHAETPGFCGFPGPAIACIGVLGIILRGLSILPISETERVTPGNGRSDALYHFHEWGPFWVPDPGLEGSAGTK
jgi:hypothetical protein